VARAYVAEHSAAPRESPILGSVAPTVVLCIRGVIFREATSTHGGSCASAAPRAVLGGGAHPENIFRTI